MYKHLMFQVIIRTYDASEPILLPRMEFYPKEAVVPDGKVEKIVEQLELESDKNVVAVILHGFGGIGKTTVADAVYAKVDDILGFKFSKVALYENIGSVPNTLAVQNKILDDISEIQVRPSTSTDGQKLLQKCFQKDPCFVYIDNVLSGRELAKVLPTRLDASKKLRLLLTARDAGVRSGLGGIVSPNDVKLLSVDSLPEAEALTLLKQEMGSDVADKLSEEQRNYLLKEVCSGVPLLIQMVSRYVKYHRDINVAVDVIRQQRECDFGEQFGEENVEFFSFALDGLQQRYTEAFFDICSFFYRQTQWAALQNMFGENTMEVLERRALIKQTFVEYTGGDIKGVVAQVEAVKAGKVHDVLLQMGRTRCKSNRITTVAQLKSMIQSDDFQGTWQGVKGIYISEEETVTEVLTLPCSKLDFISSSLRILSLDDNDNEFQCIGVEGECKAGFSSLIFFRSLFSQPPFDVRRCLQLTYLACATNCTVYLHQMPSSLKILDLRLEEENAVIGYVENEHGVVSSLRYFILGGSYLREIPHGLLSNMKSLITFRLDNAPNVWYMPDDELNTLPCLTTIDIKHAGLKGLSESIGACASLETLILFDCQELVQLPRAITNLSSLEALFLPRCSNLLDLPDNFERLVSLRLLDLSKCRNLKHLGSTFFKLPSLQILYLNFCKQLEEKWVDIFVQMKSLKVISLEGCPPLIKRWEECYKDSVNIICLY